MNTLRKIVSFLSWKLLKILPNLNYLLRYSINYILKIIKARNLTQVNLGEKNFDKSIPLIDTILTFTNLGYRYPKHFLKQATQLDWFGEVVLADESFLENLSDTLSLQIRKFRFEGYGHWFWKPIVISRQLHSMSSNKILLYCDSGTFLNSAGRQRLLEYLKLLETTNSDAIFFSIDGGINDSSNYLDHHLYNEKIVERANLGEIVQAPKQVYAGLMILKNTTATKIFMKNWMKLCMNLELLNSVRDADNGLIQFAFHENFKVIIYSGSEVNLYDKSGHQLKHSLKKSNYANLDWSLLAQSPFQLRRAK